jgi:hypothetical protein
MGLQFSFSPNRNRARSGLDYFTDRIARGASDAGGVEAHFGQLLRRVAWAIRRSGMPRRVILPSADVVSHRVFQHRAAKAVLERVIFDRQHRAVRKHASEHFAINGLQNRASITPTDNPSASRSAAACIAL